MSEKENAPKPEETYYCFQCGAKLTDKELVNGKCPNCGYCFDCEEA
jgi:DNA-directed RNA polymerase subunit RPC12/RpoP